MKVRMSGRYSENEIPVILGQYFSSRVVRDLKETDKNLYNLIHRVAMRDGISVKELIEKVGFELGEKETLILKKQKIM